MQSNPAGWRTSSISSQFATDLANNTVPDYSWISPDQCHDMHGRGGGGASDPCDFSNEQPLIQTGDSFLRDHGQRDHGVEGVGANSVIFITWDESDFTGTGPAASATPVAAATRTRAAATS